jgi:hypothetical protein
MSAGSILLLQTTVIYLMLTRPSHCIRAAITLAPQLSPLQPHKYNPRRICPSHTLHHLIRIMPKHTVSRLNTPTPSSRHHHLNISMNDHCHSRHRHNQLHSPFNPEEPPLRAPNGLRGFIRVETILLFEFLDEVDVALLRGGLGRGGVDFFLPGFMFCFALGGVSVKALRWGMNVDWGGVRYVFSVEGGRKEVVV